MPNAVYTVCIDWDNDGDFDSAHEDVTGDARFVKYKRGKKTRLGHAPPGELEIRLNNSDGKYSPSNSFSPIYANLKLGRAIRVQAVYNAITYHCYYGFISEIAPHPRLSEQDCYIHARDGIRRLARAQLTLDLLQDQKTGAVFTAILDAINWSAIMRALDVGQDTIPYAWWDETTALKAGHDLEDSERGYLYVDGRGYVTWQDRSYRNYQISQATFGGTMLHLVPSLDDVGIVNDAKVTFTEREATEVITLWERTWPGITGPGIMNSGGTYTFTTEYGGLGLDVVTPDEGDDDDWHCVDSDGEYRFANIELSDFTRYAEGAQVTITNNSSRKIYLAHFRIRGKLIRDLDTMVFTAKDQTSQDDKGICSHSYDGRFLASEKAAQTYADWLLMPNSQPKIKTMKLMNDTAINLTQILTREISDRITVKASILDLDEDYFINAVEHIIDMGSMLHEVTWMLARVAEEEFAAVGHGEVGSARVGY